MDTRAKILPWKEFVGRAAARAIVLGYFDPLTWEHAERLESLAQAHGPLLVAVDDPPEAALPADARLMLVAALRCVEAVSALPDSSGLANARTLAAHLADERSADLERRQRLVAHVHSRHAP